MTKLKDKIYDWTSEKWHNTHNWKTGTGRYLKRIMNRKIRHNKIDTEAEKYKFDQIFKKD